VINRSTIPGHSVRPNGPLQGRVFVWNSGRGNHLGQRSCASAPTGRTYGRNDLIKALQNTLRGGGRPHMGLDRGTHLGQRSSCRVDKAGHMIAIDPPVRFLIFSLASKGPSTHAPMPRVAAGVHQTGRQRPCPRFVMGSGHGRGIVNSAACVGNCLLNPAVGSSSSAGERRKNQ
jgi:hypothetical protein